VRVWMWLADGNADGIHGLVGPIDWACWPGSGVFGRCCRTGCQQRETETESDLAQRVMLGMVRGTSPEAKRPDGQTTTRSYYSRPGWACDRD
jgi:hypothetical protein